MAKKTPAKKKSRKALWIIPLAILVIAAAAFLIVHAVGLPGRNAAAPAGEPLAATDYVQIDIAGYGAITAELYGNLAPATVENFMSLVEEGFYDGLTFHRIISGFMIQGGDPEGNGTGGSAKTIKGEFAANGVQNDLSHSRGVLSMARSQFYDSASSQFFIMHADAEYLDGQYAAFGKVLSGIEVVDAICENTPVVDGNGSVLRDNQPVITAIRRIEKPE